MKPKCSKIALISTLINTGCGLSVVSLWTRLSVSQTSEAIWLYTLRYHSIGFGRFVLAVIFSACCVYLNILCIIRCLHSKSAIISRDRGHACKLPDLWPPNSPDLNPVYYKICVIIQQGVQSTKVQDVKDLMQRLIDACMAGVEESVIQNVIDHRHRHLYTCIQPQKILWIFTVTKISMIVKIYC